MTAAASAIKEPHFNVFLNEDSLDTSEDWCLGLVWSVISPKVSKVFRGYAEITDDLPLVIFDDCIYTGIRATTTLMDIPKYAPIKGKLRVILVCAFATTLLKNLLPKTLNGTLAPGTQIDTSKIECNIEDIVVAKYVNPVGVWKSFSQELMTELEPGSGAANLPIYFAHKIANNRGSFPVLYNALIKNPTNRLGIRLFETMVNDYPNSFQRSKRGDLKQYLDHLLESGYLATISEKT